MRNVDLQNLLARYDGDADVLVNGDVSVAGSIIVQGEECATVKDGTKGASGVQPIEGRRRTARSSSAKKSKKSSAKKGAKKRTR